MSERPTGLTEGAGWEIGVSRTIPVDRDAAWAFLVSPQGLSLWLGDGVPVPLEQGMSYATSGGTVGEIRSVHVNDRVRLTWRPWGRSAAAIVQLAVVETASGCVVRLHSERLDSADEREAMRAYWRGVLDRLEHAMVADDA
jgi:uncharacterized protein YndB with AHSA1/START domain